MKDLSKLRRLKSIWGDFLPMATLLDSEPDEDEPPIEWTATMLSTCCWDAKNGKMRAAVDYVRYVHNCNAYATNAKGKIQGLPIYHSAVELFAREELTGVLLLRDNALLDELRRRFSPERFMIEDQSVAEILGSAGVGD